MKLSKQVQGIRESFLAGDLQRDANKKAPEDVIRYCDIPYGSDTVTQLTDLYIPKNAGSKKLPVIVSIHGGGWVYGSKAIYQYYCMDLARRGFAVLNFTYRLAPEYRFPAALEDTNLVLEWLVKNAEKYNLDPQNVFAVGDSAGGNYLGLYAAFATNPAYAAKFDFTFPKEITLKAVGLNCGFYDADGRLGRSDSLLKVAIGPRSRYTLSDMDVPSKVTADFPPSFLMTCNQDFLLTQAPVMEETFKMIGIPYVSKVYGDDTTPLGHVFHVNISTESAKICNDDECEFFRSFM